MAVITITATGLGSELIAGIPQLVALTTNLPSIIFYTLDGSEPTVASPVYIAPIELPTNISVQLRAFAMSGADSGSLNVTFGTTPLPVFASKQPRITIDAYDVVDVVQDGYSLDAYNVANILARGSDIALKDLDIRFSRTDHLGMPPGTLVAIGFPDPRVTAETKSRSISHTASSPNNQNVFFNPKSLFVTMDGRDGYLDQVHDGYRIINRPWGSTMDITSYLGGKLLFEPNPYISGGFVRSFYNSRKGIVVSYYFDHNETRWIKSIQNYDPSQLPANIGRRDTTGPPLVFKWIYNKRSMI